MDNTAPWHHPSKLPSPGAGRLELQMKCGKIIEGVRPEYIATRDTRALGFRDMRGNDVSEHVRKWRHK